MDTKQIKLKILDLAIKGKLCPQNASDEPASELLKRIREEKARLVKEKKIKATKTDSYIYRKEDGSFYELIGKTETCIDDELPFEIPKSWEWGYGATVFNPMESAKPSGKHFSYIDIDAIVNSTNLIGDVKQILTENAPSRASRRLEVGDVLFSKVRPYLRNIALITDGYENCIASTGFYVVKPKYGILDSQYCFYMMLSSYVVDGLNFNMKGDNSPSINDGHVTHFRYPLPPFAEQKRIAKTIDKLLSYVDEIESNQQKLNQNMAAARTKLLDLAIQGKLVPQNPDDEPASKLLERIQAEKQALIKAGKLKSSKVDSRIYQKEDGSYYERIGKTEKCIDSEIPFPIPPNWVWVRLREIVQFGGGKTPSMQEPKFWVNGSVLWVTSKDMKMPLISDSMMKISELGAEQMNLYPASSLILVTRSGILRHTLPVAIAGREFTVNQDLKVLQPYIVETSTYLYYFIKGSNDYLLQKYSKSGTTVESIVFDKFIDCLVPFPSLAEQQRIIKRLKALGSLLEVN